MNFSNIFTARPRLWWFLGWATWLSLEYWGLGGVSYLRIHDNANCHIPVTLVTTTSWREMIATLQIGWLNGMDRLANLGWWHLFTVPFLFLPPWLAHGVVTWVQRFVAGYFTARLMEDCLGSRREVAWLAGMVYSLAHTDLGEVCFMHMLNEPGLPLLLWFFCRLPLDSWRRTAGVALLLGLTLGWAMSHLIGIFFLVPAALLFALLARRDLARPRDVVMLATAAGLFFAVSLVRMVPELWALALNAGDTYRGRQFGLLEGTPDWRSLWTERAGYLLRWWPFVLLTLAWGWTCRFRDRANLAILALLVLGVVVGPLLGPLKVYVAPYIGFARGVDFTRFHMVSALAWTMAACCAVGFLPAWTWALRSPEGCEVKRWSLSQAACLMGMVFAVIWSIGVKQDHLRDIVKRKQNWRALYQHPDLQNVADAARTSGHRLATAGAYYNLHPGFWLPYGAEMADGHAAAYSERYYRFWTSVIHPLIRLDPVIRGFHSWGAYVYLHHPRSGPEHESPVIPFERWYDLELLSLAGVRYIVSDKPVHDERLVPVSMPMQERMAAAWKGMNRGQRALGYLRGVNPPRPLVVHENPAAFPRFFLVPGLRVFEDEAQLQDALERATVEELAAAVYVLREEAPDVDLADPADPGAVRVLTDDGCRYALEVEANGPCILVCNNQYFRWWTWRIDGRPVDMFPAYGAFMAAVVPAGIHRVDLSYNPPYADLLHALAGAWKGTP